jgi:hypothetical protein
MDHTKFAGREIIKVQDYPDNLMILLWGRPGTGKTTLACTAPGEKLVINFDPNGPLSVASRRDASVLDFSDAGPDITGEFKSANPFGIAKSLGGYDTVVLDSLSSVQELSTRQGVDFARSIKINSNIENPGPTAFQARNNLTLELVRNLQRICQAQRKHLILISHEAQALKDKAGSIVSIPMMLGGQLPTNVGVKLSEIWLILDLDKGRDKTIAVRPVRHREVAKTRMFDTMGSPEFSWTYNPSKPDEDQEHMTIAGWHRRWLEAGKAKIPLPK